MTPRGRSGRAASTLAALLAVPALTAMAAVPAAASIQARASIASAQVTTSASWAALPTQSSAAPYLTTPLVLTFAAALVTPPPQYFWVVNTGSISLTQARYTVTETGALGLTATIQRCSGSWDEAAGTCSGTITTVATSGGGVTASTAVPAAPGAQLRLRAILSGAPTLAAAVVTTSVAVARADARAAATTTS